jgi:hypothetical protein
MRFRCAALIALWTMFSGPVFGPPVGSTHAPRPAAARQHAHPPADDAPRPPS